MDTLNTKTCAAHEYLVKDIENLKSDVDKMIDVQNKHITDLEILKLDKISRKEFELITLTVQAVQESNKNIEKSMDKMDKSFEKLETITESFKEIAIGLNNKVDKQTSDISEIKSEVSYIKEINKSNSFLQLKEAYKTAKLAIGKLKQKSKAWKYFITFCQVIFIALFLLGINSAILGKDSAKTTLDFIINILKIITGASGVMFLYG